MIIMKKNAGLIKYLEKGTCGLMHGDKGRQTGINVIKQVQEMLMVESKQ